MNEQSTQDQPPAEDGTHDAPVTLHGVSEADIAGDVASPNRMDMEDDQQAPAETPEADGPDTASTGEDRVVAADGEPNFLPGQESTNGLI